MAVAPSPPPSSFERQHGGVLGTSVRGQCLVFEDISCNVRVWWCLPRDGSAVWVLTQSDPRLVDPSVL